MNFAFFIAAGGLAAQTINRTETRLLSAPNGRPGCYAPLRVVFEAPAGATGARVESVSRGVVLTRQVNIDKPGPVEARLPWLVAEGSFVRVIIGDKSDEFTPPMPSRPQAPSFGRIYAAVFSPDVAKARELLSGSDELTCDFYSDKEAFDDWRAFDSYDAVILVNPGSASWPREFAVAAAAFCSLGGTLFFAGPGPFDLSADTLSSIALEEISGTTGRVGIGAFYRVANEFTSGAAARRTIIAACRDHRWLGADTPPSGTPVNRAVSEPYPALWLAPLGQEPVSITPLFCSLAGLLALATVLGPLVAARLSRRAWLTPLVVAMSGSAIAVPAAFQPGPPATVEISAVEWRVGDIACTRYFVTTETLPGAPEKVVIELDAEGPKRLARSAPAWGGYRAWVIDEPMTAPLERKAATATLASGRIDDLIFRDYAAKTRRGQTEFSDFESRLLDWWLEAHAYRGRDAKISAAAQSDAEPAKFDNVFWRRRGAITVTPLRENR